MYLVLGEQGPKAYLQQLSSMSEVPNAVRCKVYLSLKFSQHEVTKVFYY